MALSSSDEAFFQSIFDLPGKLTSNRAQRQFSECNSESRNLEQFQNDEWNYCLYQVLNGRTKPMEQ